MSAIDPITLEVVTEGLISVVREMRATVFRTARSVAIYEARDFSCGLFDARDRSWRSRKISAHVVPLPWSVESALVELGDDLEPGDIILMNDPTLRHALNDVTIIYPVFEDGSWCSFRPCATLGRCWRRGAGVHVRTATEIYQEGIRIPL